MPIAALVVFLLLPVVASAELVFVEPDDYSRGADVSEAVPGVVLSARGRSTTSAIMRTSRPGGGRTSTGLLAFGYDTGGFTWRNDSVTQAFFRADFAVPTNFVAIDIVSAGIGVREGFMEAFDANGDLLATVSGSGVGQTLSLPRSGADIASIQVTGARGPIVLDNFRFERLGDPPPLPCAPRLKSCEDELTLVIDECRARGANVVLPFASTPGRRFVEPDDYARGDPVSNAVPGVILSVRGRSTRTPIVRTEQLGIGRASTEFLAFGYDRRGGGSGFTWRDDIVTQAYFQAFFEEPTAFVAIDVVRGGAVGDTADAAILEAYAADGSHLATGKTLGGQGDFETLLRT